MRLLLVEDEEKLAQVLKKGLDREGYAVDVLVDGESAERRIALNPADYDLIILDVMLPVRDGVSVCRHLRENGIKTPILMLTAKDAVHDRIVGLDAGADDYLVKPFDFTELQARIRALLRRPREVLQNELKVRGLTLNTATQRVFLGKKEIRLTQKEFSILEYFMRQTGRVITREQILAHAWSFDFDSFSNVVDVHLKNLRKKLHDTANAPDIETVRGLGYRLQA
jgi:DNA-binding response OmpR family regulator